MGYFLAILISLFVLVYLYVKLKVINFIFTEICVNLKYLKHPDPNIPEVYKPFER